jgi:hypothetical protein
MTKKLEEKRDELAKELFEDQFDPHGDLKYGFQRGFNAGVALLMPLIKQAIYKDNCCDREVIKCCDKGGLVTIHDENCRWCKALTEAGLLEK